MARGNSTFRQRDLTAAVKAVIAAGRDVRRVEIEGGKVIIVTVRPDEDPDHEAAGGPSGEVIL